jgi:hypothetical protein
MIETSEVCASTIVSTCSSGTPTKIEKILYSYCFGLLLIVLKDIVGGPLSSSLRRRRMRMSRSRAMLRWRL